LKVALFVAIISNSVFPTAILIPSHINAGEISSLGVAVAHAATCSDALAVGETVSTTTPSVGDDITYILAGGPAFTSPTQVSVTGVLPVGVTYVSSTAAVNGTAVNGAYDPSSNTWNAGTFNGSNNSMTLYVTASVNTGTEGKTITPKPTIIYGANSCDDSDAAKAAAITVQEATTSTSADLKIVKTVDNTNPSVGDIVHYSLDVTDLGSVTSTGVVASDTLPYGLTFVNATAADGTDYSSSTGLWTIHDLPVNDTVNLAIAALVDAGTASTTITNTGYVTESASTTDPNLANNSSSISIDVQAATTTPTTTADIEIVKIANPTSTVVGGMINYTLTATDLGSVTSTGVVASDTLPYGLTFVNATAADGTDYSSSTGLWTIHDLSAGATSTLTIAATVDPDAASSTISNTATITESASSTDPNLANNSSTATTWVAPNSGPETCSISLSVGEAVSNKTPSVDDIVTYTLAGAPAFTASTSVKITELLPSTYLTFLSASTSDGTYSSSTGIWDAGTFNGSNNAIALDITAQVNPAAAGRTITTHPRIRYIQSDCTQSTKIKGATITVPGVATTTADVSIQKAVDEPYTFQGATLNYTLTVSANGPATSTGVVASDTLPSDLTFVNATYPAGTSYSSSTGLWTMGDMSVGSTSVLTIAATVNSDTPIGTVIPNTGTVTESASSTDPNLANNSSTVSTVVTKMALPPLPADISIVKAVDTTSTVVGATINYTLTATDLGTATSTGVVASDTLPSGLTFVNATATPGTSYSSSTGLWTIGTLDPNATATLAIAATVKDSAADTTITNEAFITEAASSTDGTTVTYTYDPNLANNSSTVSTVIAGGHGGGSSADISIVKAVDNTYPDPGATINYTLTAENAGPSPSYIDFVKDPLPAGLTFVSASPAMKYDLGKGIWTIGTLAPNATATLKIAAAVGSNMGGKEITNTATIFQLSSITDPNPANNSSSISVWVTTSTPYADVSIVKAVDKSRANEGDTLNYTLTVGANGPATSTGVVASDTLPSGLTFVNATATPGTSYSSSTGLWTIGDMSASSTATLTIAATVNAGMANTTVTNTGTVTESASSTDLDLANNSSTVSTIITASGCGSSCGGCTTNCNGGEQTAEIAIAKTVDNANPAQGATIHYTVTVSALGPTESLGVNATDTLPAGIAFVSASTTVGSYNPTTGSWSIGSLNNGKTAVLVITATVTAPAGTSITNTGTVRESPTVVDQISSNNTASVTLVVAGGGGGQVLGTSTSTGQVLGVNTCGLYLNDYIHPNRKNLNDPNEVKKLQVFLNLEMNAGLPITGYYGPLTIAALNKFQVKYHTEVLQPWTALGLPNEFTPTSYVYETTRRWINLIVCPSLNLSMPTLQVDNGE